MKINMTQVESMDPWTFSFGALMVVATKLDTQLDNALKKFDLTSKQWFLLMILQNTFEAPPTLKQLASEMGSSYQNVKQVALKLESKGFIRIEKDTNDARALRLVLTDELKGLWDKMGPDAAQFMRGFYQEITENDIIVFKRTLNQLLMNLLSQE